MRAPSSLRTRLMLGLVLGTTSLLALNGYVIYAGSKRRLYSEFDGFLVEVLKSNLPAITRSVRPRAGPPRSLLAFPELVERPEFVLQIWGQGGGTVVKSEHLGERSLPRLARDFEAISYDDIESAALHFEALRMPDGAQGRCVALHFAPPPPGAGGAPPGQRDPMRRRGRPNDRPEGQDVDQVGYELVLARDTARLRATLAALGSLLVIAWATSSAGCAAILTWIVGRGLRPLGHLRDRIQALDADELGERVDLPHAPAELRPVVEQLNGLLARLHGAFDRERSFTSDVAHELRTPLSGLRTTLEVFLARERDAAQAREAAERCLGTTVEMQALVEILLEMAAAEGSTADSEHSAIDLDALLCRTWEALDGEGRGERDLAREIERNLDLTTDPTLLGRILSNLLENASIYGDEGQPVEVAARQRDGCVVVSVTNAATAAPADVAEHAFEAFWRADAARTATGRHAGLGLPLCRRIARRLGATLEASHVDGRFTATLSLPARGHDGA